MREPAASCCAFAASHPQLLTSTTSCTTCKRNSAFALLELCRLNSLLQNPARGQQVYSSLRCGCGGADGANERSFQRREAAEQCVTK